MRRSLDFGPAPAIDEGSDGRPPSIAPVTTRWALWAACVSALAPSMGQAQPRAADKALATELFNSGRVLMSTGHLAEACAQLERSQSLDPATGTLLNLAVCHEKIGRTASAWAEFQDARILAQRDGRDDRVTLADEHLRTLQGKLCRLTIVVPPDVANADLQVRRDGGLLPREAWGVALPVDPGTHDVEASAKGNKPWSSLIDVTETDCMQTVTISAMVPIDPANPSTDHPEDSAVQPSGPLEHAASTAPARSPGPPQLSVSPVRAAPGADRGRMRAGILVGGVGLAALAAASVFGVLAIEKRHASDDECTDNRCTPLGVSLNNTAKLDADVSTVGFAIGLSAVAAGAWLWLSSRPSATTNTAITWSPFLGLRAGASGILAVF